MPSVRMLRGRIRSVKNTAQITKAMELVAASRMRRAQQNVLAARPFAQKITQVIADLEVLVGDTEYQQISPLLQSRPVQNIGLIMITADRGLAGPLNTNAIRRAARFINEETEGKPVRLITVGRRGRDFMTRAGRNITAEFVGMADRPTLLDTLPISKIVMDDYISGKLDAVYLLYTEFINTLTVRPKVQKILPIDQSAFDKPSQSDDKQGRYADFIFEPSAGEVLRGLLPRYVEIQIYQGLLENIASEQSSRMVAMRNATDKAKELVSDLTLTMNKARQAGITAELLEIAGAAAALESQRSA
jgi:F-type H+-transporting ATPase subunit gamma